MPSEPLRPENGEMVLEVGEGAGTGKGLRIDTWKSYSFNSHFLTPTDGWSFTLGDETISDDLRAAIAPRQKVALSISGHVQGSGYVDKVTTHASRGQGTELTIEGRDLLSPAIDSCIDPRTQFKPGMSLADLLRTVFKPFGWEQQWQFFIDADPGNSNVVTGVAAGRRTTFDAQTLQQRKLHLLKPNQHEGAFAFAARVSQRFGLWIWLSAEGNVLYVAKPTFDQDPRYTVTHKRGPAGQANNVLSATASFDASNQPSVIMASGHSTGGEHAHDQFTLGVVNPTVNVDISAVINAYPRTRMITTNYFGPTVTDKYARPLFLHDDESKTPDELERFLRRELALRTHKSLQYNFEVEGHEYLATDGSRIPWAIDTVVNVNDDVCGVHEQLWILSRTFTKDRSGGTRTRIEAIRQHSLEF